LIPEHVLLTIIGTGTAGTLVGTTIDLTDDKIVGTALDYGFTVPARRAIGAPSRSQMCGDQGK
jgi:hypothetical protein